MTMKQTQTKQYLWSDVGLDFCAGSKNLFPDRFKRILALGYNEQYVTSVAVAGNQVVLTYGGSHGYEAERVLKIGSGVLAVINGGEFWIDSVTNNTVTLTIEGAPVSIAGGFSTNIAPLGWQLVYEVANIHIYKFKELDESDIFVRLCFQTLSTGRNMVVPCVGKSFDITTGFITDKYSIADNRNAATPQALTTMTRWEFSAYSNATHNNYTHAQGVSTFGTGVIVGSKYHLVAIANLATGTHTGALNAILPTTLIDYSALKRPLLLGYTLPTGTLNTATLRNSASLTVGSILCTTLEIASQTFKLSNPVAANSYTLLDNFNTTTCAPIRLYEDETRQFLGFVAGGIYEIRYASNTVPTFTAQSNPLKSADIDLDSMIYICNVTGGGVTNAYYAAVPVEHIKYV